MENQNVTSETQNVNPAQTPAEVPNVPQTETPVAPQADMQQSNAAPQAGSQQFYGAPQPAMYANQPVPPMAPKKKGNSVVIGLIIAIIVLVFALGGTVAFAFYNVFANSPEVRLAKGFKKWSEEPKTETVSETLGWEKISESMLQGATCKDISLNMTFPSLEIPTIGVDVVDTCDFPNQKDCSDWEISISNVELLSFQIAADSEKLYISVPTLLEDTYDIAFEDLAANFNSSVWAQLFEVTVDESFEVNPWASDGEEDAQSPFQFSEEFKEELEAKIKEMTKTITFEEMDVAMEVSRNGKTVKCDGIYVSVPKEDLNDILDMIQSELRDGEFGQNMISLLTDMKVTDVQETWNQIVAVFDVRYETDLQMVFYLDNKNNIVHMATPEVVSLSNGISVGFAINFVGESNPTDKVEGLVKLLAEEEGLNISYDFVLENEDTKTVTSKELKVNAIVEETETGISQEGVLEFTYAWDSEKREFEVETTMVSEEETFFEFGMEGAFTDIEKNESFTLQLGSFALSIDDETLLKVSGEMEVKPLDEEVKIPSESKDLLGMTMDEITAFLLEIMQNAKDLTPVFGDLPF